MTPQRHTIAKVVLNLKLDREQAAQLLQERYLRVFKTRVLPAMESLFDRMADSHTVLRIDRLELDLGSLPAGLSDRELADRMLELLQRRLPAPGAINGNGANRVAEVPLVIARQEAVQYFLETGWLSPTTTPIQIDREARQLAERHPQSLSQALVRAYRRVGEVAIRRFVFQFEHQVGQAVLSQLLGAGGRDLVVALENWLRTIIPQPRRRYLQELRIMLFEAYCRVEDAPSDVVLREAVFRWWSTLGKKVRQNIRREDWPADLQSLTPKEHSPPPAIRRPPKPGESEMELPDTLYCSNAGIVLAHPFLRILFQELNLLTPAANVFLDERAALRGVYLLHFLATGEGSAPEYELTLPKLLCGLPLHVPLEQNIRLSKRQQDEADELLRALGRHWSALGNASPDGLREAFLQREGKLQKNSRGFLLQIEKKTIDILLDKLPWNISVIQLPWMKELLRVEWA